MSLETSKEINLSFEQEVAYDSIFKWLETPNNLFYLLEGKAGTGKSFLLKQIIEEWAKEHNIAILAPTHKALTNISKHFKHLTCKTIHKALGLQLSTFLPEFDPNNPLFFLNKDAQIITTFDLIIIDECSMVNDNLFKYISELAQINKTKVLFVGDSSQIKPVKQHSFSKTFSINDKSYLSKILRTNVDVIKKISQEAREKTFKLANYPKLVYSRKKFISRPDLKDFIVIAYTNKQVSLWNYAIKTHINPSDTYFAKGDKVMFYSSLTRYDPFIGKVDVFINGEIKEVSSIEDDIVGYPEKYKINFTDTLDSLWMCKDYDYYLDTYSYLKEAAKKADTPYKRKSKWKEFYSWKSDNFISKNIKNKTEKISKDIDLAYAITAHKSQSATLEKVAVDITNLAEIKSADSFWELLYVAITRASKELIFIK